MRVRKQPLILLAAAALVGACTGKASDANGSAQAQGHRELPMEEAVKIRITVADRTFTAVLEDSEPAKDFAALLPVELTLSDYNRTEKIADLPRRLSVEGAPDGIDPAIGDIAYYAPWGNLAIFYRDFGYSRGLIRLGRLEGSVEALAEIDGAAVRIERSP